MRLSYACLTNFTKIRTMQIKPAIYGKTSNCAVADQHHDVAKDIARLSLEQQSINWMIQNS